VNISKAVGKDTCLDSAVLEREPLIKWRTMMMRRKKNTGQPLRK
jgi:hypothetical protein